MTDPVIIVDGDDYVSVIHRGKELDSGHSLAPWHWSEILKALGVTVKLVPVEDDEDGEKFLDAVDEAKQETAVPETN